MTGRRNNNIRGPHSALTDFLAANNISARQIREDYQRRRREAEQEGAQAQAPNGEQNEEDNEEEQEEIEATIAQARREREAEQEREKKSKKKKKDKGKKKKKKGSDDEDDSDDDFELDGYKKAVKLPGQFAHCELCDKRFTVTPYSKNGPDGGLLCTPCGKQAGKDDKTLKRQAKGPKTPNKRRRVAQSERLDGIVRKGPKPLVQMCLETILKNKEEIESFGNMPDHLIFAVSKLFTKERVMNSESYPLFLRRGSPRVIIYDCAKLSTDDYDKAFIYVQHLKTLVLHNAYQFKDITMDYMIEKADHLTDLRLYAANLVSSEKWSEFFEARGPQLTALKLRWLDASFEDKQVKDLVKYCPNMTRLKLEHIWKIGPQSLKALTKLKKLEHLSLQLHHEISKDVLIALIKAVGPNLQTLSLRDFTNLDDAVLTTIHEHCHKLTKLRIRNTLTTTDEGFHSLFNNWDNPPLIKADLSATRDVDMQNPDGPEEDPLGLAGDGFKALMTHSGAKLDSLDISSCRHIPLKTLLDVFADDGACFPDLRLVNLNFVRDVDEVVLAGLFRSAKQSLRRVELFGCFNVNSDVVVPPGVVVIGAPRLELDEGGMEVYGSMAVGAGEAPEAIMKRMEQELDAMVVD